MKNKWIKQIFFIFLLIIGSVVSGNVGRILAVRAADQEVTSGQISESTVIVGGMPIGLYMETDGVLVLSTQELEDYNGNICEPAKNIIKSGDYILEMNHTEINDKKDIISVIKNLKNPEVVLSLRRQEEIIEVKMEAVKINNNQYKLGIWVRDNLQGLGTITYLNSNSEFGALGHGIHDIDISTLIDIEEGSLYKTNIRAITKGKDGSPGSMEGIIVYNSANKIGTITKNTEAGIFGVVNDAEEIFEEQIVVQTASADEIKVGPAIIRCSLGDEVKEYDIEIIEVNKHATEINKGILLKITDEELLEKTGGIIQGMSGSPIIQDGKIVGAVTHVLVNDPTRGYGIFIENMLETAE